MRPSVCPSLRPFPFYHERCGWEQERCSASPEKPPSNSDHTPTEQTEPECPPHPHPAPSSIHVVLLRGTANFVVKWQGAKKQATANIVEIKKVGFGNVAKDNRSRSSKTHRVLAKTSAVGEGDFFPRCTLVVLKSGAFSLPLPTGKGSDRCCRQV